MRGGDGVGLFWGGRPRLWGRKGAGLGGKAERGGGD